MMRPIFMVAAFALSACGGGDDNEARAKRLSEETAGAVFNGGLSGTIQKGQSVALDASLTLTQTRITCILDEGRIAQVADCGPESGWTSVSAKIPLKHIEPASISVATPDRGRGQDGLLVYFACRKDAGQCVSWTNPMPSSANGGILCKTRESCEKAAEDLAALVAQAQPDAAPRQAGGDDDARTLGLVEAISKQVSDATFNNGKVGSIERHKSLVLENGQVRLNAEICLGVDGRTLDMARCGADLGWIAITATVNLREIDAGSVAIATAIPENGESGMMVTSRCWKYAGTCVHWAAPAPDQSTLSLNCKTPAGCDAVKAALVTLAGTAQQKAADEAGGAAGLVQRLDAARRDVTHVSTAMLAAKKAGGITLGADGVLRAVESACFLDKGATAIAESCAAHADWWTTDETAIALADIDPAEVEDSSVEPEEWGYTFYLKCRTGRGDCITVTATGAFPGKRAISGNNLLCRDNASCRQIAADVVTLIQTGRR